MMPLTQTSNLPFDQLVKTYVVQIYFKRIYWWLPGAGNEEMKSYCLMGIEFLF